jgi:molybdopterin-guanine dinucleotide biosynthesis protein A
MTSENILAMVLAGGQASRLQIENVWKIQIGNA